MVSLGNFSPEGSIALGIMVGLLSTSVQSVGLTLQRKSHILEDEKSPCDVRRPPHRRRRWQLGMGMFVTANIFGSSVQISTLPLPVLSTLQASGLVFNSVCATLILNEPFTRWSMLGTVLVCSGALLIAIFGAFPAPAHRLEELLALLGRRSFVLWMILQGVVVLAMAIATDMLACISSQAHSPQFRLLRGLSYGCISGILSAHSLLVAKSAVELVIKTVVDGDNQFVHWQSWMLVLALVALALSQLHYLHRGLKLVSTSVLYPLVFCVYNIIAILDGLIYFRQTDLITPLRGCLIALGTVILLTGVLSLSWRLSDEQHAPAVGQSSLAPGLGLVEDTEDEESSIGGSEHLLDENRRIGYQTFFSPSICGDGGDGGDGSLFERAAARISLSEQDEIWDELDDRDAGSLFSSPMRRRRRRSFPALGEHSVLLPASRNFGGNHGTTPGTRPSSSSAGQRPSKRPFRRRRKSTGFPGFRARSPADKKKRLQDAVGGIWKMNWWNKQRPSTATSVAVSETEEDEETGFVRFGRPSWDGSEPAENASREQGAVRE